MSGGNQSESRRTPGPGVGKSSAGRVSARGSVCEGVAPFPGRSCRRRCRGTRASSHSFDPESGVPFGAFARRRIRILGAMADHIRASDWATRRARTRIKTTLKFQETLAGDLGRQATVDELAAVWGVNRAEAMRLLRDGLGTYDNRSATEPAKAHSRISAPRLNSCLTNGSSLTAGGRTRNATALPYQAAV